MIEELNMEDKIASFTTLCTPFKGSIIASLLLKLPNIIKKPLAFILNFWYKIFKQRDLRNAKTHILDKAVYTLVDDYLDNLIFDNNGHINYHHL